MSDAAVFEVQALSFAYPRAGRNAVEEVSFTVDPNTTFAILGPNGSGKSTLLRLMLGELEPSLGSVVYRGRTITSWERRAVARAIGFVPQVEHTPFPLSVRELVGMGRYPHMGLLDREGPADVAAITAALERCRVEQLASRPISTLSGGEMQRARIARALAQEPQVLVLDEPTTSLDLRYEMETFELVSHLAEEEGFTVVVVTHNLNLAARYTNHVLLLDQGRTVGEGHPEEVLTRATVEAVYKWPVTIAPHPGPGRDAGAPQVIPLSARPQTGESDDE